MHDTEVTIREQYGIFVNGAERPAVDGRSFSVQDPSNGSTLCSVAEAGIEDVDATVVSSRAAFDRGDWSRMRARDRARILNRAAEELGRRSDELAAIESMSVGRPIREMRAQLARAPEWLEYFAAVAQTMEGAIPEFGPDHLNLALRHPLGVVASLSAWNHPTLIALKKFACALAAGNSVILKPSELAPVTPIELGRICTDAGVPAGALSVIPGFGARAGKALVEHVGVDRIDLTGGETTGRAVAEAAGRNLVPVTVELGGKTPVIVFDDVRPEVAAAGAAFAAFIATGQSCVTGSRLLVQRTAYDTVVDALVRKMQSLKVGDPLDPMTDIGPVISHAQLERVEGAVERAVAEGATVLFGGKRSTEGALALGHFYEPTLLADVGPDRWVAQEEIFGPVCVAIPFEDEDDLIRIANGVRFGLAASVWTKDIGRALRVVDRLDVGVAWVNDHHRIDPASPWGGQKASGIGRENGLDQYRSVTTTKSVIVNRSADVSDWFDGSGSARYS